MKTKRITFVAFLLCAILMLGVGFAAVSQTLDVTGTTEVTVESGTEAFDGDVYFSEASTYVEGTSAGVSYTARVNTDNDDKGTFTVTGFKGAGDQAIITYTIESVFDQEVTLKVKSLNATGTNGDKFTVETDWGTSNRVLAAGDVTAQTTTITITVTLEETPTASAFSATFAVELEATAG